jgi:hypothetical protein
MRIEIFILLLFLVSIFIVWKKREFRGQEIHEKEIN